MLVRELDPMSELDLKAFRKIWKLSKEAGDADGAIRLLAAPNGGYLCFDEQGGACGAITYSDFKQAGALGIGWVCIPVKHRRYGEIFNCLFDEVNKLAGDRAVFMELDGIDKLNIQLAESRSFRRVPIAYCALPMPGVPRDTKVILLVRHEGPFTGYVKFLEQWFVHAYGERNADADDGYQNIIRQARALEGRF